MTRKSINPANHLYAIAEAQQGYFTSSQAVKAGYSDYLHPYHVRKGNWERIHRGIYRLSKYPHSMDSHYVVWSLWSRNRKGTPQGVYSHETALSMYDLSDANTAKLHMTVPPGFRRHSKIPKILYLHKGILTPNDVAEHGGYRVTRPASTVRTMLAGVSANPEIIEQALLDGYRTGRITVKELKTLLKDFPASKHLFPASIRKGT